MRRASLKASHISYPNCFSAISLSDQFSLTFTHISRCTGRREQVGHFDARRAPHFLQLLAALADDDGFLAGALHPDHGVDQQPAVFFLELLERRRSVRTAVPAAGAM